MRIKEKTIWNLHKRIRKRYILCFLAFCGFLNIFILRSNLSIAIIAMVKPSDDQVANNISLSHSAEFDWSSKTQAYILSSFFYSDALMEIPAGFLATKYGGKFFVGGGIGVSGLLTLFTPLCARNGLAALIIIRVLAGLSSGCVLPALHALWSKWAPNDEKAELVTFAISGGFVGAFLTMMVGGIIATYWSWEWIFYLSGGLAIIFTIFWLYFISESPSTHPTIRDEEATYIENNIHHHAGQHYSIPWKDILTSLPVWAIIAVHFSTSWIIYVMLTELPTFVTHVLGYGLYKAGAISSIPWIPLTISVCATGFSADHLVNRFPAMFVRKVTVTIGLSITALASLVIILLNFTQYKLIIGGIVIAVTSCGLSLASVNINHLDIGAEYAGILLGLSNCFATTAGFLAPMVTGYLVPDTNIKRQWNIMFIISICLCLLSLVFYLFFGAGELQPWVDYDSDESQPVLSKSTSPGDSMDDLTNRVRFELNH